MHLSNLYTSFSKLMLCFCLLFISTVHGFAFTQPTPPLTAVVTGANRGIGLEFCRQLAQRGYTVIAVCNKSKGTLNTIPCEVISGINITNDSNLEMLAKKLKNRKIDLLVNNAGMGIDDSFWDATRESLLTQFNTNAISSFLVTKALLNSLSKNAKVIMVSSRMGSISKINLKDPWHSEGHMGYSASKTALNMITRKMAIAFQKAKEKNEISVLALHPGYVQTDMTDFKGDISTETSVKGMLQQIDNLSQANSGTFVQYDGTPIQW